MEGTIDIQPRIPSECQYKAPYSVEGQIIRKRKMEIPAAGQVDYQYSTNNRIIKFYLGSADDAIDFSASYVEFILKTSAKFNGTNNDCRRYLASGGLHSLFKRIELRLRDGTVISRIQDYNQLAALMSLLYQSKDFSDHVGFLEGNSRGKVAYGPSGLGTDEYSYKYKGQIDTAIDVDNVPGADTYNTLGMQNVINLAHSGQMDGAPALQYTNMAPGDEILITNTLNQPVHKAVVTSVTSATNFTFSPAVGVDIAANYNVWRKPLAPRQRVCNPHETGAASANNGIKVGLKPMLELFNIPSYFPLWLTSGLILEMELEDPINCIVGSNVEAHDSSAVVDYVISNPKFVATTIQYNDKIRSAWEERWRSPEGLLFHLPDYVIHENSIDQGSASNFNISLETEGVSVRAVLGYIRSDKAKVKNYTNDVITDTYSYDKFGHYIDAELKSFQFRQGSNLFPQQRVDIDDSNVDTAQFEAFTSLVETMKSLGMSQIPKLRWDKWMKENVGDYAATQYSSSSPDQSQQLILAADLSYYPGPFGGLYTRNNRTMYLDCEVSAVNYVNGVQKPRYFTLVVIRDSILQIQKDRGLTVVS